MSLKLLVIFTSLVFLLSAPSVLAANGAPKHEEDAGKGDTDPPELPEDMKTVLNTGLKYLDCEKIKRICPNADCTLATRACALLLYGNSPNENDKKEKHIDERRCICSIRCIREIVGWAENSGHYTRLTIPWAKFCYFREEEERINTRRMWIAIGVVSGVMLLAAVGLCACFFLRRR